MKNIRPVACVRLTYARLNSSVPRYATNAQGNDLIMLLIKSAPRQSFSLLDFRISFEYARPHGFRKIFDAIRSPNRCISAQCLWD